MLFRTIKRGRERQEKAIRLRRFFGPKWSLIGRGYGAWAPASELSQTAGTARICVNRAETNLVKSSIPSPDLAETLNTSMPGRTA